MRACESLVMIPAFILFALVVVMFQDLFSVRHFLGNRNIVSNAFHVRLGSVRNKSDR